MMEIFKGTGVCAGIAFGKLYILKRKDVTEKTIRAGEADEEVKRFESAKEIAEEQLAELFENTKNQIGESEAEIIDIQRLMLEDDDFNESVENMIRGDNYTAAYAVEETGKQLADVFNSLDDEYMKARAADILDLARRVSDILEGNSRDFQFTEPVIVVAEDLTPSETLQMDKNKIQAFVTQFGSESSHTVILARILDIPCIIQADITLDSAHVGKEAAVDGAAGICYLEPDEKTLERLSSLKKENESKKTQLNEFRGMQSVTKDGRVIKLFSNIGSAEDLEAVLKHDSEGIGLFRSEFLFLGREGCPSEDEQFEAYRQVAEGLDGKKVIIRTMDIGADKQVGYFGLDPEENPALGLRGIRICIDRPDLFSTQLRAIYRASVFGNIAIMFPMIISVWEVERCKELAKQVRDELVKEGIKIGDVQLGIMIETPASVMIADQLAKLVDFFSVGTNDLTQYTLAIDRQNSKLKPFYDAHHPAVIEMLRMIADAAKRNGIWAGICGELAADLAMTEILIDMGYSELSVSPASTLALRKRICEIG